MGLVYVLSNPSMPKLYKIGFTSRSAVEPRLKELDSTGVPTPFEVAYQVKVKKPHDLERKIHWKLHRYRVRDNREFFSCPLWMIKRAIKKEVNDSSSLWVFAVAFLMAVLWAIFRGKI